MKRRLLWGGISFFAAAVLFAAAIGKDKAIGVTIHFPTAWMRQVGGTSEVFTQPASYEVRRSASGELLFALHDPSGAYSDSYYAIDPAVSARPAPILRTVWERGALLPSTKNAPLVAVPVSTQPQVVIAGVPFPREGDYFPNGAARLSPDGRYAAIFSYSGPLKAAPGFFGFLGGGESSRGFLFVEIYSAVSGERMFSGRYSYAGFGPSILFTQSSWLDERHFIMPVDYLFQDCQLVSLVPEE